MWDVGVLYAFIIIILLQKSPDVKEIDAIFSDFFKDCILNDEKTIGE